MKRATGADGNRGRRARGGRRGILGPAPLGLLALLGLLLAVAGGVGRGGAAVAQEGQEDAATATVRVVHGAADAGAVDLYVDGALALAGVGFPSVSDPLALPAGEHELRIVESGAAPDAAVVVADVALDAGALYEVAALGTLADLQANLYEVDLAPLAAGRTRLRVVHGSPDAGPIAPAIDGEAGLLPTVEFPNEGEYAELEAGAYDLELRTEDGTPAIALNGTELEAGAVYDLFAVGQVGDGSLRALAVVSRPAAAPAVVGPPAALYAGGCADAAADLGEVVSPLNGPAVPSGDAVGQDGAATAANSVTAVGLPFEDVLVADHAVAVLASDDADAAVVACGEVGGPLTENGALVVGLREASGSGAAGVAILAPSALEPGTTDVSVFVADDLVAATAGGVAGAGLAATPDVETERESAPTPTPTPEAEDDAEPDATPSDGT